jgi:hypothetical protein
MEIVINQTNLRSLLIEQIPEAKKEFRILPGEASVYTTLHKLYEVTSILAHQNQFKAVKRCLLVAEELLLHAEPAIKNAVSNVFLVYLGRLLDKKDSRAEVLNYLLPRALRAEYRRQLTNCLP